MAKFLNLVEKQMVLWDLKRRLQDLGQRQGRHLDKGVAYGPCLTISRQRGSGGRKLAQLVGDRLGWQVFDREILDEIAKLGHVRSKVMKSVDKEIREQWENGWVPELQPEDIGYESYLRYLHQVVLTFGHHGDVVLLGRCAQFLLPPQCALRVRVVAPLEWRVERTSKMGGISEAQAREQIQHADSERRIFALRCFQRDPDDPLNYDLVLNTAAITVEAGRDILLRGLRDKLGVEPPK